MKSVARELAGDWRIWLLVASIAVSIFTLSPNPWASGAVVTHVGDDSPFYERISEGTTINSVNGESVSGPEDFMKYRNSTGMLRLGTSDGIKLVDIGESVNRSLGVEVDNAKMINIEFGMDLVGGTRVLLEPNITASNNTTGDLNITNTTNATDVGRNVTQELENTISILRTRLDVFGLKNMQIQKVRNIISGDSFIEITAPGVDRQAVEELINRKGKFEAFIPRRVSFGDSEQTELEVGDQQFGLEKRNNSIIHSGESYSVGDVFTVETTSSVMSSKINISLEVWNVSSDGAVLAAKVYGPDDIKYVHTSGQNSIIRPQGENSYEFRFKVLVSDVSRDRFAVVTENLELGDCTGGQCYLSERIHYFIDDKEVTALNLPESTQGQVFTPWITGGAQTEEEANEEMKELQSLMSSGELPMDLKTVRVETVTATHGQEILTSAVLAGVGALVAVSIVIFLRYRNRKIIAPVLITSFSEVLIILGAASLVGRTIDLPAMAGIIAAIGSSVDDQIVITSETLADKSRTKFSVKRTVKRAFFIVYMAAATTIVAMMSLASIGVGSMRGFAIMTIIGVLAGVLITRPAYGKILERIL